MRSLAALVVLIALCCCSVVSAAPYQGYRTYRSPLRDGTFDHASMFRFTDGGSSANLPRFGYGFRDYPYAQIQYGASSPIPADTKKRSLPVANAIIDNRHQPLKLNTDNTMYYEKLIQLDY